MSDNYFMIVIGAAFVAAGIFATGISYGMPSTRHKPVYPVRPAFRMFAVSLGLFAIVLGLARVLRG